MKIVDDNGVRNAAIYVMATFVVLSCAYWFGFLSLRLFMGENGLTDMQIMTFGTFLFMGLHFLWWVAQRFISYRSDVEGAESFYSALDTHLERLESNEEQRVWFEAGAQWARFRSMENK